ncbi:hypothetical protein [Brachybacterium sp. GCM10030252]|uniref:hypothetical protein n=1 Tax=Brachybacterium sp. GCM10030252 TaxID=3273380 RepID=UPI003623D72F
MTSEDGRRERGPSLLWPWAVTGVGVALMALEVIRLVQTEPAAGDARPMSGLVLASALALGGFSLTRLLQLMRFAASRRGTANSAAAGRAARGLPEVPWQLTDAHAMHAVWVIGVGASVALMGVLGLWSALDGRPSGLEPGWPLLVLGAVVAGLARAAWWRTTAMWKDSADGL